MSRVAGKTAGKAWESAYDQIRDLILTMKIKPGASLSENRLAHDLGISRTPIREALTRLEQEGLIITSGRRKRAFVPTIHEIEEIFDLKLVVESAVARWAAERGGPQDQKALRQIVEEMAETASAKPEQHEQLEDWHQKWLQLDIRYHEILFHMAGNHRAENIISTLNAYWHRLRLGILTIEDRIEKAAVEHRQIANSILSGDGAKASQLMSEHLSNLKVMLVGIMRAFHYPS